MNIQNDMSIGKIVRWIRIEMSLLMFKLEMALSYKMVCPCIRIEIEDDVFCGTSSAFTNDLTSRARYSKEHENYKKIVIK